MRDFSPWKPQKFLTHHYETRNWTRQSTRRRSLKCIIRGLRRDLQEYCESTTLHGFRYITSGEVSNAGKLAWLTICLVSSSLSVYLMLSVWHKYTITPADITVESTAYPIWGLPFPGVSVCNINKVYKPQADKMANEMKLYGMNDSEIQCFFDALPSMIHEKFSRIDYNRGMNTLARIGFGPESFMYHLMQPCDKMIIECQWRGNLYNCSKIFKTVKTFQGFCCAFNYHVLHAELPYEGYNKMDQPKLSNVSESPGVHEPLRIPGSGRDSGLFLVINVESEMYRAPARPYFGASIAIHDPLVFPEINVQTITVQPGREVTVHVKGSLIESEESLRKLNLKQRKCWFEDEVKLNTSIEYRYESCITECRMEHIYASCDCVPFYYPKTISGARTCGLLDIQCLELHRNSLAQLEAPYDNDNVFAPTSKKLDLKCRNECLPQCTERAYTLTTATTFFMPEEKARLDDRNETSHFDTSNEAAVSIFFPDITCIKYRRESVMTWENLLASFGGIFGLCIGGSFVSLVEVFYFLMFRIYRPQKSGMSKSTLPIHSRGWKGRVVAQLTARNNSRRIELKNDRVLLDMNSNKRADIVLSNASNYSKQASNKMPFTIEIRD